MRLFVAVEINNPELIERIGAFQKKIELRAKPVELDNLHFTMQFLGEVSENQAEKIKEELEKISFNSFNITLEKIGAFPKPKFPRVLWIGTDEGGGNKMIELASLVERLLNPLGFKSDKPFKPHLTIFRIKSKEDLSDVIKENFDLVFGNQLVDKIKLKKSILTPKGPIYTDLKVIESENV